MKYFQVAQLLEDYPEAYGKIGTISFYEKCFDAMGATHISVTDNEQHMVARIEWQNGPLIDEAKNFMKQWKVARVVFDLVRSKTVIETVKL